MAADDLIVFVCRPAPAFLSFLVFVAGTDGRSFPGRRPSGEQLAEIVAAVSE